MTDGPERHVDEDPTIIEVLEERNRLLQESIRSTDALAAETAAMRASLGARPTRDEVHGERRRLIGFGALAVSVLVAVAAYLAVWAHEAYRDACEFGPRLEGTNAPAWCDPVFPGQPHPPYREDET